MIGFVLVAESHEGVDADELQGVTSCGQTSSAADTGTNAATSVHISETT